MKLDMPAVVPEIGMSPQNQKMADLRSGGWMLALEKEQLSQHITYRSVDEGEGDIQRLSESQCKSSDEKDIENAGHFSLFLSYLGQPHQVTHYLSDSTGFGIEQSAVRGSFAGSVEGVSSVSSQRYFAAEKSSDAKVRMLKIDTEQPLDKPFFLEADQDHTSRQMHLYEKDGMVQVWIRDASISDNSLALLAKSVRSELRDSGKELSDLTVNGKRVQGELEQDGHGNRVVRHLDNDQG